MAFGLGKDKLQLINLCDLLFGIDSTFAFAIVI